MSFLLSVLSLSLLIIKTFSFGKRKFYSISRGNVKKGILYAFGKGMTPFEKESTRKHLGSYAAGILYHMAIFFSFLYLFLTLFSTEIPPSILLPFQIILICGFMSGIVLFAKRIFQKYLRALSCPDDYAANFIVNLFILLALLASFYPKLQSALFIVSIIIFLYIPIGKIRHCFFFFYSRILYASFYARRGTFPPKKG